MYLYKYLWDRMLDGVVITFITEFTNLTDHFINTTTTGVSGVGNV